MALRVVDNKKKRKLSVSQPKIRTGNLSVVKTKANPYPQQRISVARGPRDIPSTRPRGFLGQTLYPAVGGAVRTIANVIPSAVQAVGNNLERGRLIDIPNAVPGIGMLDDAFYNTSAGRKFQNVTAGVTRNAGANIRAFGNEMTDILDQKRSESRFRPGVSGENRLLTNLGEGAGSLGAAAAVTYATGNTGAAAGVFGLQAGAQQIRQARDAGMSPQAAQNIGIAAGATEAALEKLGLDIMFRNNPATSTIRNTITKAVSEGLQEFSQSISQSAYSDIYKDVDYSDAVAQALQEGGIGAILGGGVGGVQSGINTAQAQQIKNNVKRYAQEGVVNKVANDVNAEILQIRDHIRNLDLAYDKMKREGFSENHQAVKDNRAEKIRWTQELNRVFQKAQNLNRINVVNQKPLGLTLGGPLAADFNQQQAAGRVFEGVDGKPRFEIDDSGAKLGVMYSEESPFFKPDSDFVLKGEPTTVGEAIQHSELFKQYPFVKDIKIKYEGDANASITQQGNKGGYDPATNTITIGNTYSSQETLATILHEIQHAIQQKEGFAGGGNLGNGLSYNDYLNLAGEAEARAVAARMNMSDGERYKTELDRTTLPEKWQSLIDDAYRSSSADEFVKSKNMDYHGTNQNFDTFSKSAIGSRGEDGFAGDGFYFTSKKGYAKEYGDNIIGRHLNLQNPYVLDNAPGGFGVPYSPDLIKERLGLPKNSKPMDVTNKLKEMGHDGVVVNVVDATGRKKNNFEKMVIDVEDIWSPKTLKALYEKAKPQSTFYDSLDVPKEDLIIRDGGGKAMSIDSITPNNKRTIDSYSTPKPVTEYKVGEKVTTYTMGGEVEGTITKVPDFSKDLRVKGNDFELKLSDGTKLRTGGSQFGKAMSQDPATQRLLEEAKKYKSAEEFVKSQNIDENFNKDDRFTVGLDVKDSRLPDGYTIRKQHYDVIGDENFMGIEVFDKNEQRVAKLDFGMSAGGIDVKMIEVDKGERRKGIATAMLDKLQEAYPDVKIRPGMSTEDGSKLLKNYDFSKRKKQLTDIYNQAHSSGKAMSVEPQTKKYKTVHQGGKTVEVEGEPIDLVKGVETFVHKDENGNWTVSEATTGRDLTNGGFENKTFAIKAARDNIMSVGESRFKQLIKDSQPQTPQLVHTMPDGSKMAGPEHEGAVPGSTVRVRTDQDADQLIKDMRVGKINVKSGRVRTTGGDQQSRSNTKIRTKASEQQERKLKQQLGQSEGLYQTSEELEGLSTANTNAAKIAQEAKSRQTKDASNTQSPLANSVNPRIIPSVSPKGIIPSDVVAAQENKTYPVTRKVNVFDYLRTPDKVLTKIGLKGESDQIRQAHMNYKLELPKHIDKVNAWYQEVGESAESSQKIFRWLDGNKDTQLNDTELKVAKEIKQYLKDWADRLALPKDNRITDYITHIFEDGLITKEFDPELEKLIGDRVPGSVYSPFTETRIGVDGYVEDVFRALDAYIKRSTRKVNMDNALYELSQASEGLDGSAVSYVKKFADRVNLRPTELDNLVDNYIKSQSWIGYRLGARPTNRITRAIRNATYRGTLGLNVGSAIRNLTQGVNTFAELGFEGTYKGYVQAVMDLHRGKDSELMQVGVLTDKFIEDRHMSSMKSAAEKFDKGLWFFFDMAERINRGAAYYGAKSKALSEGKSVEQAIAEGYETARKTQFTFGAVDNPVALNSDIARTIAQFQSFNIKQTEFIAGMVQNKEWAKLARMAGAVTVVTGTIGQILGYEPEDFFPPIEIIKGQSRFGKTPFFQVLGGTAQTVFDEEQRNLKDFGRNVADPLAAATIPGSVQAEKTIFGLRDVTRGYAGSSDRIKYPIEQTPGNWIMGGVFGPYYVKEAREYYDQDRRPLGAKQSAEYLSVSEAQQPEFYESLQTARDYNRGLESGQPRQSTDAVKIKAETTQEYRDYLAAYGLEETKPQRTSEKFGDLIYTDDTISTARSIVKGTKAADMPEWVKVQWLEENGLTLDQVELDLAADLKVAQKANFLQSELQGMSEQQKIAALAPYLEETISGKYFASYGTLRELRDRGVITDSTYDAIYQATSGKTSSKKRSGGRSRGSSSKAISIARQALKPINLSTSAPQTVKISNPNIGTSAYRKARRNTINVV